mgnify:CR=1 FL=1
MANNNENKILNVPHLRFPEFSGEWENTELQYIAPNICSGKDKPTSNGTVALYGSTGIIGMTRLASYNEEIVLVARVGANAGQLQITTIPCGVTDNTLIINAKEWNRYIYYYLQHYNLNRLVFGSGQPLITGSMLKKLKIIYGEESERNKIVNLLCLLDERIATQNKIIEDLKKLKSAISKHLFARKDLLETTICLSNIATLKNGYAFQSGKYNALGKWKILTITNVPGERYINDEDCNCIINLPNDIQDHQVLKEGDILISLTGNVGRVSLCKNGDYLLNQRVGLLQLSKNVNREFLYQILSSQRFENSMIACGQGAAQMNIGKGDVESYVLPYSSNGNNILWVAKILHSYDERIINELRRLTLLTMQKQYLLTQMFI